MSEHQEINDVAPTALNHIIGQGSVVAQVKVAVEAAFADSRKFDHALLVGGPGLGKTQMATVIACEMASDFQAHKPFQGGSAGSVQLLTSRTDQLVFQNGSCQLGLFARFEGRGQ